MIAGLLVEADAMLERDGVSTVVHEGSPWALARRVHGAFQFGPWRDFESMPPGEVPTVAHADSPVLVAWSAHSASWPHIYERELYEAWVSRVEWFRVVGGR